jgi:hypothetical protein
MLVRVRKHQIISKQFMFKGMSKGDHVSKGMDHGLDVKQHATGIANTE